MSSIREIEPSTLNEWLRERRAILFDVREPDEFAARRIPGARSAPLSRFDPGAIRAEPGQALVVNCKGGKRSLEAAARLAAAGCEVCSLKGGLDAWTKAGLPTDAGRGPAISIIRQVQLTVGVLTLAASILAYTTSPGFLLVTGVLGAGLAFAGATGTCGLAAILARMPWNRLS
ncbi:MAG: rhodanese family protein [Phycisphaerales bacterium]|nr:rhodanese family protein [Phycisphaerales bacterium]